MGQGSRFPFLGWVVLRTVEVKDQFFYLESKPVWQNELWIFLLVCHDIQQSVKDRI